MSKKPPQPGPVIQGAGAFSIATESGRVALIRRLNR